MDLVVFELGLPGDFGNANEITQDIKTPSRAVFLRAIRPHLYVENTPAGSLFVEVQNAGGKTIKASNSVAVSSITSSTYFHGYVRFDLSLGLSKDTVYRLALKSSGYTFGAGAFVGWCGDFDLRKYAANVPSPVGVSSPLDFELWEDRKLNKGAIT